MVNVDAWAFKILFFLYGALGIKDAPVVEGTGWTIIDRWTELPNQTYRFTILSNELPKQCAELSTSDSNAFVIFPQTYMGQMKLFIDNRLIYTNSMSKFWNISQLMSKPLYSCSVFLNATEVRLEITAYMQFFTSVSGVPEVKKNYPYEYVFYDEIFVIASVTALFLGFVGAILLAQFADWKDAASYLMQQVAFSLLVGSHVPGRYFDMSVSLVHTLVVVGGFAGLITLIINTVKFKYRFTVLFLFLILTLGPTIVSTGYKNATHLMVLVLFVNAVFGSLFMAMYKISYMKRQKDYLITGLYVILFLVIVIDGSLSQIDRVSYLHLSSIAFVATTISFMMVLSGFNKQQKKLYLTTSRLESEIKTINTITTLNNAYREIIHDIKSPITSLNFVISAQDREGIMGSIGDRLQKIINRIEGDKISKVIGWYSVHTFISRLKAICTEKSSIYSSLAASIDSFNFDSVEIRYDPIDISIVFEEIFDNVLKYSDGNVSIKFKYVENELICIVTNKIVSLTGDNMLTRIGQGIGLTNVRKKINEMGGKVEVQIKDAEFQIYLKLNARTV